MRRRPEGFSAACTAAASWQAPAGLLASATARRACSTVSVSVAAGRLLLLVDAVVEVAASPGCGQAGQAWLLMLPVSMAGTLLPLARQHDARVVLG